MLVLLVLAGCATGGSKETLVTLIAVDGGTFQMGSDDGRTNEQPAHSVSVGSFLIGATEVTQGQWLAVMGAATTADRGEGENFPVYNVTWQDAVGFCNTLSQMEGLTPVYGGSGTAITCDFGANGYRLPTEAEWEYAAGGGSAGGGFLYAGSDDPDAAAWFGANSESSAHEVGQKLANELGIFDMSGNIAEWCWDWYDSKFYADSPGEDPQGPATGSFRVIRGGNWGINETGLRITARGPSTHRSDSNTGFRVARTR